MAEIKEYRGLTPEKIFNIYDKLKVKYPGLQDTVSKFIGTNPEKAYDTILEANEKHKENSRGFVGAISSLEDLVRQPVNAVLGSIRSVAEGIYDIFKYKPPETAEKPA